MSALFILTTIILLIMSFSVNNSNIKLELAKVPVEKYPKNN